MGKKSSLEIAGIEFTTDKRKKDNVNVVYEPTRSRLIATAAGMWKTMCYPLHILGQMIWGDDVKNGKERERLIAQALKEKEKDKQKK